MKIFAETERLILREIIPEDVDGFFELDSNPEVHRFLGNKPLVNKQQCEEVIKMIKQQYVDNGIGRWAITDKTTKEFMGWTGLKLNTQPMNNHVNYYDVGYRLIQNFWGRGIAQESAKASLEYGFRELKLKEIYAAAHVDNIASDNILTNVGLRLTGRFDYEEMPCNWYEANFEDWNNQNRTIICKN